MRAAGFGLAALTTFEMTFDAVAFDALEADAASQLTEGEFKKWAIRGYLDP